MSTDAKRLSPTSYVVLGLIGLRGPSTPYDLKQAVGHSVGHFWPFPHSQLYQEPDRLVGEGLLAVAQEQTGRRRKTYSLTEAGRRAVRQWLKEPAGEAFQVRNIAELKLFFSELGDDEDVVALAEEQIALHEKRLAEFEAIDERFAGRTDLGKRLIPLRLGRRLEEAALEFWREFVPDEQS
ncbi:MAG TPA: PadR family transcriptional regulator [Streptomyces sp.]|nr:PadR family transcriptional regulator [Streptomyces sp.]